MKKIFLLLVFLYSLSNLLYTQDYLNPNLPVSTRVNDLLARMTLKEKIGQMVQAEKLYVTNGDLANYCIGSLLSGGNTLATPNNSAVNWADMYDNFQRDALNGRLKIPMIYGVDAVHGFGNVYGSTVFPHNIGLGATRDADLMEEIGKIVAREVAATGIDWMFGPCLTVPRNERWGRTYEGFGEDPQVHEMLTRRYILGIQGAALSGGEHIVACAKHWVGDGGTTNGIDQGNTVCSDAELRNIHIAPYLPAIQADIGTFMISYSSFNGTKCHASKYLITDLLKTELGFKGFVVSDYDGVQQIPNLGFSDQIKTAVNAGIDMFMIPQDWKNFLSTMENLVNSSSVSIARINDAVSRILTIKFKLGLFEKPYSDRTLLNSGIFGSQPHRDIARRAVRESCVLLKNTGTILPLSKNIESVFVAGKNANDIGNQCGGWTCGWQGSSGNVTVGTTILDGIKKTVSSSTRVTFSQNGTGAAGHKVAIVVVGETPYAEGQGDRTNLGLDATDLNCLNNVKSAKIPMIVITVSGRPLIITDQIADWSAFVAAWLPGTEGQGVADVLFGDYNFAGKLPCSWPRSMAQIPINVGDANYDPLFSFGFGLTYPSAALLGDVNGDSSVNIIDALLIAQYCVGFSPAGFNAAVADVNHDGSISIVDALLIAQYSVGIITNF